MERVVRRIASELIRTAPPGRIGVWLARTSGLAALLCRRRKMTFPTRENQDRRMALERSSKHLGTLNTQPDTIIFDGRQSGLGNASALRKLVLAQTLQLANDAYRFPD
jgi:hypothetical protein